MRIKRTSLAAVSVLACAILVGGCSSDRPTALGPGVVTPTSVGTDQPAPTDSAPTGLASSKAGRGRDPLATRAPAGKPSASASVAAPVPRPLRDDDAELDADGQLGDGRTVFVEEAQITRADGFVAVFAAAGGRLLGSEPVARSAEDRPVTVSLDEPISSSTELVVVLHADDGDGHFDPATDPRVAGDDDDITDLEVEHIRYRLR